MRSTATRALWTTLTFAALAGSLSLAAQEITSKDLLGGLANPARWLTYSGDYSGQRHSPLTQITSANANRLTTQWTFQTGISGHKFEATPIVIDGTMYVTGPEDNAWAVDARTGKQLWSYTRQLPPWTDLRICCGRVNRGFAVWGDRLLKTTLDAHLIALDRATGKVLWDVEMGDHLQGYASTVAPLVIGDKVIAGIAGGEFAIRGFLDAYDPRDGKRLWRFWTVPEPGQPGSETWPAEVWERGGGPTWLTGTYDPQLNTLYWGTGNPNPDFYGADRKGDNLYTNSLIALDADKGTLKWHFQFTPFDEHDWDANQIPVLARLTIDGKPRDVVMVANRNGFFYVLDRATGQFIRGTPFIRQTWAKAIGSDGRPIELPNQRPTPEGTLTCPDLFGGTNFMSPAFDPSSGLFFVSARETCQVYISQEPPEGLKPGDRAMGGRTGPAPNEPRFGALRAIDAATGQVKWELRHDAPSWAGVLSTAGGVVMTGDNDGHFIVVDAKTGKEVFRQPIGAPFYSAPITYMLDGRQYVAVATGSVLTTFALPR